MNLGRGRACALGFSIACALDLLWAKTWSNTDHYRSIFCVAGAFSLHVRKEWEWKRALYLLCAICRNLNARLAFCTCCLAGMWQAWGFRLLTLYFCMAIWVQVIVAKRHYLVHVSVIVAILCEGALASHPHPTSDARVAEYECKSLWLNVIILCKCQWTSPFWCACERTLLTSHPTPPHTTPQGSWLIVSCVSAQVSEIYVTQCASEWRRAREWNFQCASECLSWTCDSMNQRSNDWVKSELSDSGNQWINEPHESMSQWRKGWMDGRMNEWMDGWATFLRWASSSLSALFAEAPLLSATSSLSSHLSGLLVLWAASHS